MPAGPLVILAPNYHPRVCGVGDNSLRLAQALRTAGVDAVVLTFGEAAPHPEAPDVPVHAVPDGTAGQIARRMGAWLAARAASGVVLQYTAQGYRAGRWGSFHMAAAFRALRRRGIPRVLLVHEPFVPWSARPDRALTALLQRLAMAALGAATERVVITTETRRRLVEPWARLLRRDAPVDVLPIGANALPAPTERHEGFVVGTFSMLSAGKRHEVVLQAFAEIARQVPEARLVLLGDIARPGDPRSAAFLGEVSRHPAASRIRVPGRQSLVEVAREIASLDVFLFPQDTGATTRSSTLPTALGAGVPVVAIRGQETDGLFVDGENLLFAEALTGPAFAQAVARLRADPALARRVSAGALALFEDRLAWPRLAAEVRAKLLGEVGSLPAPQP